MSEIDNIRKQVRLEIGMGYRDCVAGDWARRCRVVLAALDGEQAIRDAAIKARDEALTKLSEVRKLAYAWLALKEDDFDIPTERMPTRVCAQSLLEVLDGTAKVVDL